MKWFVYFSFAIILALVACEQEEETPVPDPAKYQGKIANEFSSYQIRYFIPGPIEPNVRTIHGSLGGVPILAGVTEAKEIIFMVPDLPPGNHQLKLDFGVETRIWDARIIEEPIQIEGIKEFWDGYFEGSAAIYDSLGKNPWFSFFIDEAQKWSDHFLSQFSKLSAKEKDELIYLTYRNGFKDFIPFNLKAEGEFENCLDENFALFKSNTFENNWNLNELKSRIAFLPSSILNDAFLAFLADLLLRDISVEEFLGPKIFTCPILKEVDLKSKFGWLGPEPVIFSSGDSVAFEVTGGFSPLHNLDGSESFNGLGEKVSYITTIKNQRASNATLIYRIQSERQLDLPSFSNVTHYGFPVLTEPKKVALSEFDLEVNSITNPAVILSNKEIRGDKFFLTFEKTKEGHQDFSFSLTFHYDGFKVQRILNASVVEDSELILDLFFDSGTAYLQILSGKEPFEIVWSNGITNQSQANFPSGNHSVKVRGGNDREKVLEFSIPEFGKVKDREGNEYQTVKIGDRWWMAENLRNTIRMDGRPVPLRSGWPSWNPYMPPNFDFASYSPYLNDPEFGKKYGNLYNLHAVIGCLCPEGWEIPTTNDFENLAQALGGNNLAGKVMKKRGRWEENIAYSSNEAGFNGLPGGFKESSGDYKKEGTYTAWWARNSNHPDLLSNAIAYLEAESNRFQTILLYNFPFEGHYIRCIKKE